MARKKIDIERMLSILYFSSSVFSLILSIIMGIIWSYWRYTLNSCIDINCGCLLYATTTYNTFIGANISICRFATFGPILPTCWSILIGSYHTYRVCILKQRSSNQRRMSRPSVTFHSPESTSEQPQQQKNSRLYVCFFVMSLSFLFLYIALAIVTTSGYYSACEGYRKAVIKHLSATGNLAAMVYERTSCGTIFDFLDYVQSDPIFLETRFRRGTLIINTGILMQVSIISAWMNVFIWITISFYNASSAFRIQRHFLCCEIER